MSDSIAILALFLAITFILHRKSVPFKVCHSLLGDLVALLAAWALFTLLLFLTERPWMTAILALLAVLGIFVVNKAKMSTLHGEPLIFTDIPLFLEGLRVPAFYLPFLPWRYIVPTVVVGGIALICLWNTELKEDFSLLWSLGIIIPLSIVGLICLFSADKLHIFFEKNFPLEFDPTGDVRKYGLLGAMFLHCVWHLKMKKQFGFGIINQTLSPPHTLSWPHDVLVRPWTSLAKLPNIFLIQSESFADLRPFSPHIPKDILTNYDSLCREGIGGQLELKYYGANTMRTEFAILTGSTSEWLTTDSFNPYLTARNVRTWSLAFLLKEWGYKVVCVHPFYPEFFNRHRVIPNLGFDAFISLGDFSRQDYYGPHISDAAVANKMISLLNDDKPVFCFAITMENHGPWRSNRFENVQILDNTFESIDEQTQRYLVHLKHADNMLKQLANTLVEQSRPGVLAMYGDHLPSLKSIPIEEKSTPFVLWSTSRKANADLQESVKTKFFAPSAVGGALLNLVKYTSM